MTVHAGPGAGRRPWPGGPRRFCSGRRRGVSWRTVWGRCAGREAKEGLKGEATPYGHPKKIHIHLSPNEQCPRPAEGGCGVVLLGFGITVRLMLTGKTVVVEPKVNGFGRCSSVYEFNEEDSQQRSVDGGPTYLCW